MALSPAAAPMIDQLRRAEMPGVTAAESMRLSRGAFSGLLTLAHTMGETEAEEWLREIMKQDGTVVIEGEGATFYLPDNGRGLTPRALPLPTERER